MDVAKLQPIADRIIKKYLLQDSAELPVTLSSAHQKLFKKKPAQGVYTYSLTMFDAVHKQVPIERCHITPSLRRPRT